MIGSRSTSPLSRREWEEHSGLERPFTTRTHYPMDRSKPGNILSTGPQVWRLEFTLLLLTFPVTAATIRLRALIHCHIRTRWWVTPWSFAYMIILFFPSVYSWNTTRLGLAKHQRKPIACALFIAVYSLRTGRPYRACLNGGGFWTASYHSIELSNLAIAAISHSITVLECSLRSEHET
ncbi:uncharacterized protein SCHCODRAFT_02342890 [Schizophyllum commune H4-8]|uniref:uncharacterized protein n=1 Tax=Schizophyllum commune (strain H4-8 / FGSC 9210) TaxID=578458 RepID=UPI00215EF07A|nr:uncharacterized protein SCHCODRAFT_02342890 [Schizophyllum commune H4-8]KAI5890357.1 hypothetical protein SCHCODRAFT_02342890 [Schizophyllum commune H4-8]